MGFSRRHFVAGSVLGAGALGAWVSTRRRPSGPPVRRARNRVFVMGFDGMDPTLTKRWMDDGDLPNLRRLAEEGSFSVLGTTQPSESPTAWASFATGVNPGKHNIFDFLVRDVQTYLPDLAMIEKEPAAFLWGLIPTRRPKVRSTRGGTSFWTHAGRDGIRSAVLTVPVTFPVEDVPNADLLAGFPLPDIRGTMGTFSYWASDLRLAEQGNTEFGGILARLVFEGGAAGTVLVGPDDPRSAKGARRRLEQPLRITWQPGSNEAGIEIAGTRLVLSSGDWSDWVSVGFSITPFLRVHGMVQFHLIAADEEIRLYASPVNLDPRSSPLPISSPEDYASTLASQIGLYRTLGWAEPTWALNEGRIDEATFMADCDRALADRERIFFERLKQDDWDLFLAVVETTDRVQHMMWRHMDPMHPMHDPLQANTWRDAIRSTYRRCDALVGRLRERLPKDAVLMVMSDHGFHSFRRCVNLNTWLVRNGYMVREGVGAEKRLADLFGGGQFFEGVDWSTTRAYALGLGQIYINLRGREAQGIVSAGADYTHLLEEMRGKLLELTDPDSGERVLGGVYLRDELYTGEYLAHAPDLQAGFNDGYRVGWQDTLGGIRPDVIENNTKRWSGDHCGSAKQISGGVLFINRPLVRSDPHIMDMAPTILGLLDVPLPGDFDGQSFL